MGEHTRERCGSIDFWKAVFTLVMVLFHSRYLLGNGEAVFTEVKGFSLLRGGYICAEFFAIVSGYLMAASAQKKRFEKNEELGIETWQFIKRKIGYIFPYYLVALFINFVVLQIYSQTGIYQIAKNALYSIWSVLLLRMSGVHGYYPVGPAWYISAMLLLMFVLYPWLRKWRSSFSHIIAPIIFILGMGYLSMTVGHLCVYSPKLPYSHAMIRIAMDLCMGIICYSLCEAIKKLEIANCTRVVFTIVEIGCFLGVIAACQVRWRTQLDFIWVLVLAVGVIISFSGKSGLSALCKGRWTTKLARWSVALYFCHENYAHLLRSKFTSSGYMELLPYYLVLSVVTAVICILIAEKVMPACSALSKKLFLR